MAKATNPVPAGHHTVTPQLTLAHAATTIEWYKKALGAEEVARAVGPLSNPAAAFSIERLCARRCYVGAMASARSGLPLPFTIRSGAAITTAPVAGSWSRLHRLASPNFPLPRIVVWFGNGGW